MEPFGQYLSVLIAETNKIFKHMNVRRKQVEPLGFKGSGMYAAAATHNHYYKSDPINFTVTVIGNMVPQTICRFQLNPKQYRMFKDGKLSLVPPGCCNPSGGPTIERCEVLFEGTFKSMAQIKQLLGIEDKS